MKAQNLMIYVFLLVVLISQINTNANTYQEILHIDSRFPKVCTLEDKGVIVISPIRGEQKTKESKLDLKGNVIYGNSTLPEGITGNAQVVQPLSLNYYLLFNHNDQSIGGQSPNEFITRFKQGVKLGQNTIKNSIYEQRSLVALKGGKIFYAGLVPRTGFGATTSIEVNVFDLKNNRTGTGISFPDATSKYVSCFELTENNIYCAYVSFENDFVSKLRIKHCKINDITVNCADQENKKVIKNFYTEFNFLKAVKFNDTEAVILFQTGNGKKTPKYGNSGKDLYYYHLEINEDSVHVKRYEYLFDECVYKEDSEDFNADIFVLSQKRIFAACETEDIELN